jgi:hypothetical protein
VVDSGPGGFGGPRWPEWCVRSLRCHRPRPVGGGVAGGRRVRPVAVLDPVVRHLGRAGERRRGVVVAVVVSGESVEVVVDVPLVDGADLGVRQGPEVQQHLLDRPHQVVAPVERVSDPERRTHLVGHVQPDVVVRHPNPVLEQRDPRPVHPRREVDPATFGERGRRGQEGLAAGTVVDRQPHGPAAGVEHEPRAGAVGVALGDEGAQRVPGAHVDVGHVDPRRDGERVPVGEPRVPRGRVRRSRSGAAERRGTHLPSRTGCRARQGPPRRRTRTTWVEHTGHHQHAASGPRCAERVQRARFEYATDDP